MKFWTGNRALIPVIVSLESAILFEEKCVISMATSDHNAGILWQKIAFAVIMSLLTAFFQEENFS